MSRFLSICLLLVFFCQQSYAQNPPSPGDDPQLSVPLTISDGVTSENIHFGLDVRASDGVDSDEGLGEERLH